ncbi:MarC family protein [Flammeovirga agarivorans]|uniref:UPF0056 membrane protein n=1 Tax=Flammeovirga agarivorans TaxID=2726742 RepID=A0A7X8SMY8_9BACT|nr:MarC family protein [Flammeovirga agarivorans]NLR93186.1 MarC family protein [Flammeovirga agarivorans]
MHIDHYLQGFLTIFSLVNPVICAQIFNHIESGKSFKDKLTDLTKVILIVGIILAGAAFFGARLLHAFGISLDAFQVAGGIVLTWMGFGMLSKQTGPSKKDTVTPHSEEERDIIRLILFAASPGTITGTITLAINQSDDAVPMIALISIAAVLALTWIIIAIRTRNASDTPSMLNQVTTRFMGLIVLSMGIQFALVGILDFIQNYPHQ